MIHVLYLYHFLTELIKCCDTWVAAAIAAQALPQWKSSEIIFPRISLLC